MDLMELRERSRKYGVTISDMGDSFKIYKKGCAVRTNRNWTGSDLIYQTGTLEDVHSFLYAYVWGDEDMNIGV